MNRKILQLISQKNLTLNQIAFELKISRKELINRLELMEHMGYIKIKCQSTSEDELKCSCCPLIRTCPEGNNNNSFGKFYELTTKGKRICNK